MMTRRTLLRRLLSSLGCDQRGAAMVEFTLVAPFLLFLALGMTEFGRFLYQYQLVLEGMRDGARYLARVQDPTTDANKSNAENLALYGKISPSLTDPLRVEGWDKVTFTIDDVDNSDGSYRGDANIEIVHASTTFDYADVGFLGALGLPALSVAVTHEQRAIRD